NAKRRAAARRSVVMQKLKLAAQSTASGDGSGVGSRMLPVPAAGTRTWWQVRISAETPVPSPAVRSQRRVEDLHLTTTLLARRVGRSRSDLAHTVRLLELPDEAIELLSNGALTKGHGKALLSEADRYRRRELAEREAQPGWSVRALEAEIARASPPLRRPIDPHPDQIAAAAKLHELLARATGCHIEARPYRIGYQLILDQDAVDRLAEILGPAAGADQ
ncbi:MAG: ParB/RepB/Spo0J family partition protein, partial [Solirubrobacteraceae bacterium]